MNPQNMTTQQKIQWLKSQGVSDEAIKARISGGGTSPQAETRTKEKEVGFVERALKDEYIPKLFSGVGATLGGMAGGFAGIPALGVGAIPGAIVGAGGGGAAGYAGGRAVNEMLQDLFGYQDEKIPQQLSSALEGTGKAGASSAAGEAIGLGVGKVLGKIGPKIFNWGLRKPTNIATSEFVESAAKNKAGQGGYQISEEMIKRGIKGTPENWYNLAGKGADSSWDDVMRVAKEASEQTEGLVTEGLVTEGTNVAKEGIFDTKDLFEPLVVKLRETPPGFIDEAGSAYGTVYKEVKKLYGDKLTLMDLVELNKSINSKLWTAADNPSTSQAAKAEAYRAIDQIIKPYLQDNYPKVAKSLSEYGFYKTVQNIAKQTGRASKTPPSNILQTLNLPFKFLRDPSMTTNVGSVLYNAQNVTGPLGAYLGSASANGGQ